MAKRQAGPGVAAELVGNGGSGSDGAATVASGEMGELPFTPIPCLKPVRACLPELSTDQHVLNYLAVLLGMFLYKRLPCKWEAHAQHMKRRCEDFRFVMSLAVMRPFARIQLATRESRIEDRELALVWLLNVVRTDYPAVGGPCERCLAPTGNWCELCDRTSRFLCTTCEDADDVCDSCCTFQPVVRQPEELPGNLDPSEIPVGYRFVPNSTSEGRQ